MTDEWNDIDLDGLTKYLAEYLDILRHDNIPYKPEMDEVRRSLRLHLDADDKFIEEEFERLSNGYDTYTSLMSQINLYQKEFELEDKIQHNGFCKLISCQCDENTVVTIKMRNIA